MNFRTWHRMVRLGFLVLLPMLAIGFLAPPGSFQAVVKLVSILSTFSLGLMGAVLCLLMKLGSFRFACPACRKKQTAVVPSVRGNSMMLMCTDCGIFHEAGFLKLKLRHEPFTDEEGNPLRSGANDNH